MIVGSTIALCTGIFLYKEYAVKESTKPKGYGGIISQRPSDARKALDIYRQNFELSRQNVKEGRWWTLITHTLAHGNWLHLIVNMMALWSVGRPIVLLYGPVTFVSVWLAAGVGGGYLGINWPSIMDEAVKRKIISKSFGPHKDSRLEETQGAVGASGSILGMIGVLTCAFPRVYLPQTLAIAGFSVICAAFDLIPELGHIGHLGGMATGAAWWLLFLRRRRGR
jgi:membrane associated rhomboid family serine protease